MRIERPHIQSALALGIGLLAGAAGAAEPRLLEQFRSFTEVPNVCPTCEADKYDRIKLTKGGEIRAWIVAENDTFYTLERLGEVRALGRKLVASIQRAQYGRPDARSHKVQILWKNGHLISGELVEQRDDIGLYKLRHAASGSLILSYRSEIALVFDGNKRVFPP